MKKTFLTLKVALAACVATLNAQNVTIPDANFKAYLVGNTAINTNSDTEIQVSEAAAFTGTIDCNNLSISDATGIEYFTVVTQIKLQNNQLSSIDLSQNTSLTHLWLSNNTAISTIDISNNTNLIQIYLSGMQLTSLDISNHIQVQELYCQNNDLSTLNVKNTNNSNFIGLYACGNPNLSCIQIDAADTTGYNWTDPGFFCFDAGVTFSNDCGSTTDLPITAIENIISISPNPTVGQINFATLVNVQVTSLTGQIISDKRNVNTIDIAEQPNGIYFLTLTNNNGKVIQRSKIVKE